MIIFAPMKKLLYITGIILLFAANTMVANTDFFGARVEVLAKGGGTTTRFVTNSKGVTTDLQPTLNRIATGGKHPHVRDGSVFRNAEGLLPQQNLGFYREFVHPTPGLAGPGPMRIVTGQGGQMWFTPDHYRSFIPIAW